MNARSEILAAVRAAVAQSQPDVPAPDIVRDYRMSTGEPAGSPSVIAEFVETLQDYNTNVVLTHAAGVPGAIDDCLEQAGASTVVVPTGLDSTWRVAAAGRLSRGRGKRRSLARQVFEDSRDEPLDTDLLASVNAVVTAARVGISLSGTIVLDGERDQGRRAITLLPDIHVCVIGASQVHATVPQAVAVLDKHAQRPQTWIAGPSATSDIELVRVDGVHGPRSLSVIIVEDA